MEIYTITSTCISDVRSFLWGLSSFVQYNYVYSSPHNCFLLILSNKNIVPEKEVNIFVQITKIINPIIDMNMPVSEVLCYAIITCQYT